jgi:hypothetical protein
MISRETISPFPSRNAPPLDDAPQLLDPLPVKRAGPDAQLEAVELGGVVAARDHDTAIGTEMVDGEIKEGRRADAHVDHLEPGGEEPLRDRVPEPARGKAAVAPEDHRPNTTRSHERGVPLPEQDDRVPVKIPPHQAADVVLAEDQRIDRRHQRAIFFMKWAT